MSPEGASYDCVIIGGGHNGLICGWALARASRRVLVLEAAATLGGAAGTREFAPGFKVSSGAHLLHLLPAYLRHELDLDSFGLKWAGERLSTTALTPDGAAISFGPMARGLEGADASAYTAYAARMQRFAAALAPLLSRVPPRLGTSAWSDRLALLRLGWEIRRLGRRDMRELLRIIGMNVYDLLEENFQSPLLKGALGFDAVLGSNFGPRSPGTVLTLLYRLAAEHAAGDYGLCQPQGGMGAFCEALARAATAAGAVVRANAPVARILIEADRAAGVLLESGETIKASTVVSSVDPKSTFLNLLGARHLDTGFVRRIKHIRARGVAAKLHLALAAEPRFTGLAPELLRGRLLIAPSLDYLEHAYNHVKYHEYSAHPAMEITVPTVNDASLAPPGRHVLSAIIQYVPYAPKADWANERSTCIERALDVLERFAPRLRQSLLNVELSTPADMERDFRSSGGHWHQGDLAFDQFLMVRPVPGAAQYATPLAGLFLCGAGCHPGGGVMGVAGRNAAREVLQRAEVS